MKKYIYFLFSILSAGVLMGCEGFLDEKPEKALMIPSSIEELHALLDNDVQLMSRDPALNEIASDDIYCLDAGIPSMNRLDRAVYFWEDDPFQGSSNGDWNNGFAQILIANIILDGLGDIERNPLNEDEWNNLKGRALFTRAYAYFNLLKTFTLPYSEATAFSELGLPLRLTADINQLSERAGLHETYLQVITDLEEASSLLTPIAPVKTRPRQAAALALLARVYLVMGNYQSALEAADNSLAQHGELLDYNELDPSALRPFVQMNEEVLFHSLISVYTYFRGALTVVNDDLLASYSEDDLRKGLFFRQGNHGHYNFKGNYSGTDRLFGGLSTNEVYFIKAESQARLNDIPGAMETLNQIMQTRWAAGKFVPFEANDKKSALEIILTERRKELLQRGLRWVDLRRLNLEPEFQKELTRSYEGHVFTLAPNSLKYAFPIPDDEISRSGIVQNHR